MKYLKVLMIGVLLAGCGAPKQPPSRWDHDLEKKLIDVADVVRKTGKPQRVKLSELTTYPWDRVYLFHAYYPFEEIDKKLGYKWRPAEVTSFQVQDGYLVMAFVKNGRVITHYEHKSVNGDFTMFNKKINYDGYKPEEAVFELRKGKTGDYLWLAYFPAT